MKGLLRKAANTACRFWTATPWARRAIAKELETLAGKPWTAALIHDFVEGFCGADYGLGAKDKARLVKRFQKNVAEIQSGTSPLIHIALAREILSVPPETKGDVVECGVWKGAGTAALSLVCERANRRLIVCDSFEGLPDDGGRLHLGPHARIYGYYKPGMFKGTLDEVRENVRRCGAMDACVFLAGFFAESLKQLKDPIVCAFLDVDLVSSTRECLRYIWPLLVERGAVFTDDAADMDVAKVFFDEPWWQETFGCPAPGCVGAGCGLPLNPSYSTLGYARKIETFNPKNWRRAPFLHYPDEEQNAP